MKRLFNIVISIGVLGQVYGATQASQSRTIEVDSVSHETITVSASDFEQGYTVTHP